jgi:hypothetical protein
MAGKPSADMHDVMALIRSGVVPHKAALQVGVHPTTVYRSSLYKGWRDAKKAKKRTYKRNNTD